MTEDEVDRANDETLCVQLVARVGQECILITPKLDTIVALIRGMGRKSKILTVRAHVSKRVSDIQVVELGIWIPLSDGGRLIIVADVEKSEIECDRSSIPLI